MIMVVTVMTLTVIVSIAIALNRRRSGVHRRFNGFVLCGWPFCDFDNMR